jgi:hypothetical protein
MYLNTKYYLDTIKIEKSQTSFMRWEEYYKSKYVKKGDAIQPTVSSTPSDPYKCNDFSSNLYI